MGLDKKIKYVINHTDILLLPKKYISIHASTTMRYYIIAEPLYKEFEGDKGDEETVVREGKISWQKPKLITPSYMMRLEGFSQEARNALKMLAQDDNELAMLLYGFRFLKSAEKMEIVAKPITRVAESLEKQIHGDDNQACGLIKGVDEFWDISLFKFIQAVINNSAYHSHMPDMLNKNYININAEGKPVLSKDQSGIPIAVKLEINKKFQQFEKGEIEASELKKELDRWQVFEYYEDRFLSYF